MIQPAMQMEKGKNSCIWTRCMDPFKIKPELKKNQLEYTVCVLGPGWQGNCHRPSSGSDCRSKIAQFSVTGGEL